MKKILLIGQDSCSISNICWWTKGMGYNLDIVATGNAAINKLKNRHYDVVMTSDVSNDYIDGNMIAYWLKKCDGQFPMVIGLSDNPRSFDHDLFDGIYPNYLDFQEIKNIVEQIRRK